MPASFQPRIRRCPHCGAQNSASDPFCRECRRPLAAQDPDRTQAIPAMPPQPPPVQVVKVVQPNPLAAFLSGLTGCLAGCALLCALVIILAIQCANELARGAPPRAGIPHSR